MALVGEAGRDVQSGTFHAVCARVLRRDGAAIGLDPRFVIYDSDDQQTLMKQLLREEDLPTTGEFRPAAILGAISRAKNEMVDADAPRGGRPQPPRADRSPGSPGPTRPGSGGRRARLRRHPARGGPAVPGGARRPRPLPGALALPPRRRVPGHEPGPVPVGPGARRALPQPRRRRRRRPVDLLVARRRPAQHPRLRARRADRDGRQARAELPLDAAHPRRRPRGRQPERGAQGQEALDRRTPAAGRSSASRPTTRRRRPSGSPARSRS